MGPPPACNFFKHDHLSGDGIQQAARLHFHRDANATAALTLRFRRKKLTSPARDGSNAGKFDVADTFFTAATRR